jgi:Flp pilus assembly protein TadB
VEVSQSTENPEQTKKPEGMGWRVSASILTLFGALVAVVLWLSFYEAKFNVYQNIAVVAVIFLSFVAIMGATWASWGLRNGPGPKGKGETTV